MMVPTDNETTPPTPRPLAFAMPKLYHVNRHARFTQSALGMFGSFLPKTDGGFL